MVSEVEDITRASHPARLALRAFITIHNRFGDYPDYMTSRGFSSGVADCALEAEQETRTIELGLIQAYKEMGLVDKREYRCG